MPAANDSAPPDPPRPVRVAIVGGGCAGLAAAWQLSTRPGYEISIYERSWRLGGKGASGRDRDGRIREHGLHIWLGFYENAFRMMQECYAEVGANHWGPRAADGMRLAHASMDEAFFPEPHIGVAVRDAAADNGNDPFATWAIWSGSLPPAEGMPGDPMDPETNPFTLQSYLLRCYELLKTLMLSVVGPADGPVPGQPGAADAPGSDPAESMDYAYDPSRTPEEILAWSVRMLRGGVLTAAAVLLQAVWILRKLLENAKALPQASTRTFQIGTAILEQARKQLDDVVAVDPVLRRKTEIIELVITIAVGLYRDRVLFNANGFDAINAFDYREWLLNHGANPSVVRSEFITGIYDLTFAYDAGKPQLAAGVALRGALRMFFTYRGSMFWRMRSGMGDAVFAPLYKVLLARKVRFHFLHTLKSVAMSTVDGDRYIRTLQFATNGDAAVLDGLADQALDHFGCWPEDKHLFDAAQRAGAVPGKSVDDFDAVIFATGADDFFQVADDSGLFAQLPDPWTTMRESVKTVATQSAQVWLKSDLEQLGWRRGSGIVTALGSPFETWADMTHTLATEKAWRATAPPGIKPDPQHDEARSVAYFCAVRKDDPPGSNAQAGAEAALAGLLAQGMRPWWPAAFDDGHTAGDLLVGAPHVQANVQGSDRYTLSLPGSIECRISPLDRSVVNMSIAGDWTASGLDAGCVEAAVMSGMLAAFAISNDVEIIDSIVGYDHP